MPGRCVCLFRGPGPLRLRENAWRANAVKPLLSTRCTRAQSTTVKAEFLPDTGRVRSIPRRKSHHLKCISCQATKQAEKLEDEVVASDEVLPDGVKRLHITVPAEKVTKAWQKAIKLEGRSHDFPGFRQGKKVPDALIIQRVGKETVANRAIASIISDSLQIATKQYAPNAYEDSLVLDTPSDAAAKFESNKDFSYSASLTVQPEVRWKGSYKGLRIEVEAGEGEEALKKSAEEKINAGLKDVGSLRIVQGRGLKTGDVAIIDIDLRRKEDGQIIEGSQQMGKQIDTATAQHTVELPGFIDDIQGMTVGERRELDYTLPDTWWEPSIKGTKVTCNVALKELFMWELPKLTDQVAKVLLPESKDVNDFQEKVLDTERLLADRLRVEELHSVVCKQVADLVDVEIPEFLYRTVGENEYQAELLTSQANGSLTKEEVEQLATEELLLKYMSTREEHLRDMVRVTVGMEAIWQEQDLDIDEEQAKAELESALEDARQSGEDIDEDKLAAQVYEAVKGSKIIAWLVEQGEIVEVPAKSLAESTA